MWYQDRGELDRISEAGVYHYISQNGNPIVRMNASFWLECEKDDTAFTEPAMRTGNWEAWLAVAIMRELNDDPAKPTFIDIGANNGYYTLMAATAGYVTVTFEPNPLLVDIMDRSLRLNNVDNFETHCIALSDKEGTAKLYQQPNHSGASSLESSENSHFIEVEIDLLDVYYMPYEDDEHVVLKVDVEGHERNVWNGAKITRETTNNVWFLEWVPVRHGEEYNREWLTEVLETHDLQMVNYDGTLRPVGIEEALEVEFETIVFRKR